MRPLFLLAATAALVPVLSGCYQPVFNVGVTPGAETLHLPTSGAEATSIYGVSPQASVDDAQRCARGFSVEPDGAFLHSVTTGLVFGVLDPLDSLRPCVAADAASGAPPRGTLEQARARAPLFPLAIHLW
jgi:hypothetical protein